MFKPFYTEFHAYDDLHALLISMDIPVTNKVVMKHVREGPPDPITHIHIYIGRGSDCVLDNLKGFVVYNNLVTENGVSILWGLRNAVAVGYNCMTNTVLDLPMSTFPWSASLFCFEDNPKIFQRRSTVIPIPSHTLFTACSRCKRYKMKCIPLPGLRCVRCQAANVVCAPSVNCGEENSRFIGMYDCLIKVSFGLSPPYRLLIQTVKVRVGHNGEPFMNQHNHAILKAIVDEQYKPQWDSRAEELIVANCGCYQVVRFTEGVMRIDREQAMHLLYGFEDVSTKKMKKIRAASVIPFLGLDRPALAYSLIDNAMSRPGQIFYINASILMRNWNTVSARLYMTVANHGNGNFMFVLGWQIPA